MQDLHHLLDVISRSLPGLQGRIGAAGADLLVCGSEGNDRRIAALYQHWQQAHPEAGPHYWTVRSWTYLVWQPIYLTLLGVHLAQRVPCLASLGQAVQGGVVSGFCLPEHCPQQATEDQLIGLAASQLEQLLRRQHVIGRLVAGAAPTDSGQPATARAGGTLAGGIGLAWWQRPAGGAAG